MRCVGSRTEDIEMKNGKAERVSAPLSSITVAPAAEDFTDASAPGNRTAPTATRHLRQPDRRQQPAGPARQRERLTYDQSAALSSGMLTKRPRMPCLDQMSNGKGMTYAMVQQTQEEKILNRSRLIQIDPALARSRQVDNVLSLLKQQSLRESGHRKCA